jgi:hypothetical protein
MHVLHERPVRPFNEIHFKQHGFHPYAIEIATLVREGCMGRDEGLERLSTPSNLELVDTIRKELDIDEALVL